MAEIDGADRHQGQDELDLHDPETAEALALACLFGFVAAATAAGFLIAAPIGLFCAAGAMLVVALLLAWSPTHSETEAEIVARHEQWLKEITQAMTKNQRR